jgi:hypothetical protein
MLKATLSKLFREEPHSRKSKLAYEQILEKVGFKNTGKLVPFKAEWRCGDVIIQVFPSTTSIEVRHYLEEGGTFESHIFQGKDNFENGLITLKTMNI